MIVHGGQLTICAMEARYEWLPRDLRNYVRDFVLDQGGAGET